MTVNMRAFFTHHTLFMYIVLIAFSHISYEASFIALGVGLAFSHGVLVSGYSWYRCFIPTVLLFIGSCIGILLAKIIFG